VAKDDPFKDGAVLWVEAERNFHRFSGSKLGGFTFFKFVEVVITANNFYFCPGYFIEVFPDMYGQYFVISSYRCTINFEGKAGYYELGSSKIWLC
jgi:hypothetical protein